MDFLLFPYFLHVVILVLSLLPMCFFFFKFNKSSHPKLPPGKRGWPLLGESIAFAMTGRGGYPEKFVNDRMQKYSPDVFRTSLLVGDTAFLCGASGNKFIFTNENKYFQSWWPKAFLECTRVPYPDKLPWLEDAKKFRKLLAEFIKPEGLLCMVPIMDSIAKEHLTKDWYPHKRVIVLPLIKKHLFALSCRLFMGVSDPNTVNRLLGPCARILAAILSLPINLPGTALNKAIKASKAVTHELFEIINQRKIQLSEMKDISSPDLLTCLLLFKDDDGKSICDAEVVNRIWSTLLASYDAATNTITLVIKQLAEHPDVYDKVLEEQMEIANSKGPDELLDWKDIQKMKYSWCVVCETMRVTPPCPGAFREVKTEFTFAGYTIPKGWKVFWTVFSTHKDPKHFPDPEKFDPSRFQGNGPAPYTYLPFGGGPHICPGREYAKLEVLVFIHNMVTKFKWNKVIEDEKIVYSPTPSPANGLPILLQPHQVIGQHTLIS